LFVAATEDNPTKKERKRGRWELLALKLTAFQLFMARSVQILVYYHHSFNSKTFNAIVVG